MASLQQYYADFHIHIGRTKLGAPVKISAAPTLTLDRIVQYARDVKGMDMIGVIDCHVPQVLEEIKESIDDGVAYEQDDGGIRYSDLTLLLGAEIEIKDEHCLGPIHVLVFMPTLQSMEVFSEWMSDRMKNRHLSSQRIYERATIIQKKVRDLNGLFIPAHVFTPFKSVYGKGVNRSITEILDPAMIDAIELGLSSDSTMADDLQELHSFEYVTNSDAHSLEKIAREYQVIQLASPTFAELTLALQKKEGRHIVSNYGLQPLLGKYYTTTCAKCHSDVHGTTCTSCGSEKMVKGVSTRIAELKDANTTRLRPPYVHQIPLEFIPGVGPKTLKKLREAFQTDMNIIHHVSTEQLQRVIRPVVAEEIIRVRSGNYAIQAGGGGTYGKMKVDKS